MAEYQDYSHSIVKKVDFLNFVELAKSVFDPQWRFLISLRKINSSDSMALKAFKERQVFCQMLAMQRSGERVLVASRAPRTRGSRRCNRPKKKRLCSGLHLVRRPL